MKQDKNKNNVIGVTAKHLADANRLNPPRNNYIVWIVTDNGIVNNVGQLITNNAEKASLTITTPFNVNEIFHNSRRPGRSDHNPAGVTISRTTFNK